MKTKVLPDGREQRFILNAVYWARVEKVAKSANIRLTLARRRVHSEHPMPEFKDDEHDDRQPEYRIAQFARPMVSILYLNKQNYDKLLAADEIAHKLGPSRGGQDLWDFLKKAKNVNQFLTGLCVRERMELTSNLMVVERKDLLEKLSSDPFYGTEAGWEAKNVQFTLDSREAEAERRSKLHPNIRALQDIGNRFPWICSVHFPYSHPARPHLPPNCLTVLGDGSPIFRVEVMDPEECTQFRFFEILPGQDRWFDFSGLRSHDLDLGDMKRLMQAGLEKNLNR